MVINQNGVDSIIAFKYIKELYINRAIDVRLGDCIKALKFFDIYLIDRYGYVIAEVKKYEEV
jgi:hypothetical protein